MSRIAIVDLVLVYNHEFGVGEISVLTHPWFGGRAVNKFELMNFMYFL